MITNNNDGYLTLLHTRVKYRLVRLIKLCFLSIFFARNPSIWILQKKAVILRKILRYSLATLAVFALLGASALLLPKSLAEHQLWLWFSAATLTGLALLSILYAQSRRRLAKLTNRVKLTETRLRALRVAIERSPTSILVTDPKGFIEYVNPTICRFTGYSIEELIGKNSSIFNSGKTPHETYVDLWQTLARGQNWNGRFISQTKTGDIYLEQAWIAPVFDEQKKLVNYVAVKLDISEQEFALSRERLHNQVLDLLSRNKTANEIFGSIIRAVEKENQHIKCAIFLRSLDGVSLQLATAPSLPTFLHHALQQIKITSDGISVSQAAFYGKRIITDELSTQAKQVKTASAAVRAGMLACWAEPIFDVDGKVAGVLNFFKDQPGAPNKREINLIENVANLVRLVIERSQNTALLKLAETVYHTSSEAIAVTDAHGTFIHVNPAFTKITGYTAEEAIGNDHSILKSGRHSASFYDEMWASLNGSGQWQGEVWNRRKNGELYPQLLSINSTYDTDGSVKFRISLFADISKQKANEELIWRQANFDSLTGLANRRYFQEVFQHSLKMAQREKHNLAIIFIDLDEFKPINDMFGHQYGDQLLAQTAQRIKTPLRDTDIVARIGGDEFVILLAGNPSKEDALLIARRIHEHVLQPFEIDGQVSQISLSCGVSMYPEHGKTEAELIKQADIAMYHAKNLGRNQTVFFEPEL